MKVQIDKRYPLRCSAEIAWEFLQNIEAVAGCMPGAKITERVDVSRYKGTVTTKVGPATMSFRGEVQITESAAVRRQLRESRQCAPGVTRGTRARGQRRAVACSAGPRIAGRAVERPRAGVDYF
jgi:carbon monoxide dehydrogenase subunit G